MTPVLWLVAVLSAQTAAAAGCDLSGPADARFRVPVDSDRVHLVIELWPVGADPAWAPAILDALDARHVPAVLAVPAAPPDPVVGALLDRVRGTDHDAAVVIGRGLVPGGPKDVGSLEKSAAPVRARAGKVKTLVAPLGARTSEALMGRAGFSSLVDAASKPTAEPRMAGHFEGQQRLRVVLPTGPYEDACGPEPDAGPFTPAAADRVAQALIRAARVKGTPVVRLALIGSRGAATDADVLGRWLDEVVLPGGVRVVTAEQARIAILRGFRTPASDDDVLPEVGGRLVGVDDVAAAAAGLGPELTAIPRTLPGDLDPTEAFLAFALVVADRTEGPVVRLRALHGPAQLATTVLTGETELPVADVRSLASQLVAALPTEVPAALAVGGRLLTAPELLLAFASVVRGEDPARTRPIDVPDPNARGLGWGDATVP